MYVNETMSQYIHPLQISGNKILNLKCILKVLYQIIYKVSGEFALESKNDHKTSASALSLNSETF